MSIENTAPATDAAQTTPAELQNANAQIASDGAGMDASSTAQPGDAQGTEDRETPEHRKASYRFSEMSKQNRELQLRLAKMEGMLEALRGAPQAGTQATAQNAPTPAPAAPAPQPPNPSDFAEGVYDPRYIEAVADYRAELKVQKALEERAQHEQSERQKDKERQAYEQGQQRFNAVFDAAEKAGATGATQVLEIVASDRRTADLLMNTAHPVETADWLADNQEWLTAIRREADPVRKALLVGRIDQHISQHLASHRAQPAARSTTPAQTTEATSGPPATPGPALTATQGAPGRGSAVPFNPESAPFSEFEAYAAQVRGRRS